MKRALVLGTLLAVGVVSLTVVAQQAPAPSAAGIDVQKLADNLFVLQTVTNGGGGNTSVFVTATGVTVVDTKNPGWGQPLLDKIKTLTSKPVTLIVNTHTHGDHVSGNVEFPATVDVVAHENTKANMMAMRPPSFVAPPAGGPAPNIFTAHAGRNLPKRTFKDVLVIGSGADQIELHYFGRAHTNGDAMVLFPAAHVLHMADVFPNKGIPGMDSNNGGSGVEFAATLTKAADFADKAMVEKIVNGHNVAMTTRAELREYIEYVKEFVKTVQDAKKAGKTPEQVGNEWKTPARFKGYEATPVALRVKADAELIYKETK
jgi:glyoxylase-like metal-dependent hydrolase (beta-lactamase superfamily II)